MDRYLRNTSMDVHRHLNNFLGDKPIQDGRQDLTQRNFSYNLINCRDLRLKSGVGVAEGHSRQVL